MQKFFEFFKHKGALATVIGLLFAIPVNAKMIYSFYLNVDLSKDQLWTACILNAIAVVWFILPSVIKIESKFLNVIIED